MNFAMDEKKIYLEPVWEADENGGLELYLNLPLEKEKHYFVTCWKPKQLAVFEGEEDFESMVSIAMLGFYTEYGLSSDALEEMISSMSGLEYKDSAGYLMPELFWEMLWMEQTKTEWQNFCFAYQPAENHVGGLTGFLLAEDA
ncbi:MAG: hypothetical protein Q4C50_05085 [Eubacteriales bacterium]|nr:hypothetical protein [Eubacteriales bacterium]